MMCRGVRGATTVEENTEEAILKETRRLLTLMVKVNDIETHSISSIFLTATEDLDAAFPAAAARQLLGPDVPLLCSLELNVKNPIRKCVRILLNWNTQVGQSDVIPVYLNDAKDLIQRDPPDYDDAAITAEEIAKTKQEMIKLQEKRRK